MVVNRSKAEDKAGSPGKGFCVLVPRKQVAYAVVKALYAESGIFFYFVCGKKPVCRAYKGAGSFVKGNVFLAGKKIVEGAEFYTGKV